MKFENLTPDLVYALCKEAVPQYPIDWGMLAVDEHSMLKVLSLELLEKFSEMPIDDRQIAMLCSIACLQMENFCLNLKLLKKNENV